MKFEPIMATTLEEVLIHTRGNQTEAAAIIGVNRGTLRKYLEGGDTDKVLIVQRDGKLTPFVADRRNGHYKKG